MPGLIGGLLGGAAMVLGGGWYSLQHGPIKAGLDRLDATAATAGEVQAGVKTLDAKLGEVGTGLGALTADVGGLKSTLEGAQSALGSVTDRVAAEEAATRALKTDVLCYSFRAASQQVIGRLEAVNAKLVEVEQHQPADVVDKKTVADIAGKQAAIEQGQQTVSAALARARADRDAEPGGGQQAGDCAQTMVEARAQPDGGDRRAAARAAGDAGRAGSPGRRTRSRRQRSAMPQHNPGDPQRAAGKVRSARTELQQKVQGARSELQQQVQGARSELQQQLADTSSRLTTEGAERERSVGSVARLQQPGCACRPVSRFVRPSITLRQLAKDDQVVARRGRNAGAHGRRWHPDRGQPGPEAGRHRAGPCGTPRRTPPTGWTGPARTSNDLIDLHPADQEAVPGAERGARRAPGAAAAGSAGRGRGAASRGRAGQ